MLTPRQVFRAFETDGVPGSGEHEPDKLEIIRLLEALAQGPGGVGIAYDVQVADLAARAAYNAQPAGFRVLVSNAGDGRAAIYTKNSNTSADWSPAAYLTAAAADQLFYANRAAIKAITNPSTRGTVYLTEAGREGWFTWRTGDYSVQVTADTLEGLYLKADNTAASAGAWVRGYPGSSNSDGFFAFRGRAYASWFGAKGSGGIDNSAVFAALPNNLASAIVLAAGAYEIQANTTINCNLEFEPGARIRVVTTPSIVTINGLVNAKDTQQIFQYVAASHIYLGPVNKRIPVQWFYVANDNGTESISVFLNDQMELWPSDGREFIFPKGKRLLDVVWNLRDRNFCTIRGAGGLIRSQIDSNVIPKWPGGGSSIVLAPGLDFAIFVPDSGVAGKRISGLTIDGMGFIGNAERTVNQGGIFINEDNDGVIVQNCFFINLIGQFGVLAFNADAMTIENNWIAEGTRSIKVENSIELRIINNHLGAQPSGITIDLINAERFVVAANNIFPDGQCNINILNSRLGEVYGNYIHSRYVGSVQITGSYGVHFHGNTIRVPWNSVTTFPIGADPLSRDTQFGILRVVTSDDCLISDNQIWSFLPANSAIIRHVSGSRTEYVGGIIRGNASTAKFVQDGGTDVKLIDVVNGAGEATFNGGTRTTRYKP